MRHIDGVTVGVNRRWCESCIQSVLELLSLGKSVNVNRGIVNEYS